MGSCACGHRSAVVLSLPREVARVAIVPLLFCRGFTPHSLSPPHAVLELLRVSDVSSTSFVVIEVLSLKNSRALLSVARELRERLAREIRAFASFLNTTRRYLTGRSRRRAKL